MILLPLLLRVSNFNHLQFTIIFGMELMKLIGLGWKLKENEILPETIKEVQIVFVTPHKKYGARHRLAIFVVF